MSESSLPRTIGRAAAAAAGLGAATAVYANRVELNSFRLHRVRLPRLPGGAAAGAAPGPGRPLRILHISDLHMTPGQRRKQRWVAELARLRPDLVVNTGDNLGAPDAVPAVLRALGPLLEVPGVFVFGTNDYFAPRPVNPLTYLAGRKRRPSEVELPWRGMRAAFIEHGWRDATHRRLEFTAGDWRLAVTGVDDPHHGLDDHAAVAGPPNPDADLAIALTHSPEPRVLDAFAADGYRLAMAGHTHGGQVCLPGGRALVTNCGLDASRVAGLSRWTESMALHVSNGLGTSPYAPVRLFCPPSATLLEVA
ncbi:metallophosphoesterase [Corynebacterium sphenisci]|uniref:metallophosphoesterase n=1 Tax=Corynebacterium sphenisci TaxID=191493 RepID=UPI0026E0CFD7|nr:metallophosphoesterase [Corynebacterium sphenisci]MDO5730951.1 metallophosphoesterase [Corynebacterium sphenisci]